MVECLLPSCISPKHNVSIKLENFIKVQKHFLVSFDQKTYRACIQNTVTIRKPATRIVRIPETSNKTDFFMSGLLIAKRYGCQISLPVKFQIICQPTTFNQLNFGPCQISNAYCIFNVLNIFFTKGRFCTERENLLKN